MYYTNGSTKVIINSNSLEIQNKIKTGKNRDEANSNE